MTIIHAVATASISKAKAHKIISGGVILQFLQNGTFCSDLSSNNLRFLGLTNYSTHTVMIL